MHLVSTQMLPQEIIEEIIDCLLEEKSALQACSLTSRAFLPRTRTHLFFRLVFRKSDRLPSAFLSLFGANENVALAVKHVVVAGLSVFRRDAWPDIETEALAQAFEGFTALQQLSLVSSIIPSYIVDVLCNIAPRIHILTLNVVTFELQPDAYRFLRCLVSLQELRLSRMTVVGRHELEVTPPPFSNKALERLIYPRILHITLPVSGDRGIVALTMGDATPLGLAGLETLTITLSASTIFREVLLGLLDRAMSLRRLVIGPAITSSHIAFGNDSDEDRPPRLNTVREISVRVSRVAQQQNLLKWLARGLEQPSALQQMHLTLFIDVSRHDTVASWAGHGDAAMWEGFDRVLCAVKTLRTFHIRLEGRTWHQLTQPVLHRMKAFLEEHLHGLRTSGVLHFEIYDGAEE
ncbi:hypothetical protein CYLTODRAFT_445843 [Cylindrobasidium torrendii FP15055 ss-10]|uniref:F-box domain-containing protein n=1 Tax=Cylindrobasidium torrendii FP15055 ss-10 TaxID=1314674 RepID=A0A0D7B560_9AGAR|nr:hypothetical protein CYLTODRAFT_445843 [Cylindrobasidium torrendii FP15055 ss-10]